MSDEDVKKGQLVWDESDMGCGKGKLTLAGEIISELTDSPAQRVF
jgi:hypothetical protein